MSSDNLGVGFLLENGNCVRPLESADAAGLFTLLEKSAADDGSESPTRGGITSILERLGTLLGTDSLCVISDKGEMIAAALVLLPPASGDEGTASLIGVVHPDHHKQGLGTALLDWMERRVRTACETNDTVKFMRMSCDPMILPRVRLFEQQGFKPGRYKFTMQKSLTTAVAEPAIPSELTLTSWKDEWLESARSAFNKAFEGHWGLPTISEEMWKSRFIGVPQFRSDLSWVAIKESQVIGVCINWVTPDHGTEPSSQGWIEAIGVVPEHRGRGVADAMMAKSLNAFLEQGLTHAALDVDTKNATGALRLYAKYGFVPIKSEAIFVKPLS